MGNLYGTVRLCVAVLVACTLLHGCDVAKRGPLYPTVETADQASDLFQDLCQSGEWPAEADSFLEHVQNFKEVESAQLSDNPEYVKMLYRSGVLHVFYCEPEEEISEESEAAVNNAYSTGSSIRILSGFPINHRQRRLLQSTKVRVLSAHQSGRFCGRLELQGILREQICRNQRLTGLKAGISMG